MHKNLPAKTLVAVLLVFVSNVAKAEPIRLKVGTLAPEGTPWMDNLYSYLGGLESNSPVGLEFVTYPGGVMGDEPGLVRKLKLNQLQVIAVTVSGLARLVPETLALSMPFLFNSYGEVDYVVARMMPVFKKAARSHGYEILSLGDNGWVNIYSKNKLASIAELQESKVWAWNGNPMELAQMRALGISGHPIGVPDVMVGLQTGLLDTVMTSATGVVAMQWHTQLKYQYRFHIRYEPGALVASSRALKQIPQGKRASFFKVNDDMVRQWALPFRKQNRNYEAQMNELMEQHGVENITWEPAELATMRTLTEPLLRDQAGGLFPREILDQVIHYRDEYRAKNN